jgi:type VI secretion system secreted protein VgrG
MALKFSIRSGALPEGATVAGFRGSEGLSRPYVFEVFVNVLGDEEVEPEDAVGCKATLEIIDGVLPQASWSGIIAYFELVRAVPGNSLYLARIVPRLWQLSLTRHSRIFTKQSIPEVIAAVLDDEGITDYELRLKDAYETEEHVCQYKESSLDFLHRWMEREGLYYFFEQTDDGDKLVIADDKSAHDKIATGPVRYFPTTSKDMSAGRHFDNLTSRAASLPATVKLTDYDYVKPSLDVSGSASVSPNGFGEVRDYGARFFSPAGGARMARLRAEELRSQGATYHATGAATGLYAGFVFTVEEHPRHAMNRDYVATSVEHFGYLADLASAWGDLVRHEFDDVYRVDVTAISADLQYRHPSRTPWPRVDGYENGVIDGAATSEYAQIDDHGRYLVKFKFDEGTLKDGKASTYCRMMQPHAGAIEGWHFPQRKGTEVVFMFLGGDPDRPVIAGAIPNATTPSPVTSGNHTRNVIQTGGRNRFELEDLAGEQRITLSTPHSNTYIRMGSPNEDHELIVKTDLRGMWKTGHNTDFNIKGHWWIEVDKDKHEKVMLAVLEEYDSTKTEKVPKGLVKEEYHSQDTVIAHTSKLKVTETTSEQFVGDHTVNHDAKLTETIGKAHAINSNDTLVWSSKKDHTLNVTEGNYKLDVLAGKYDGHVATTYEMKVDGAKFEIKAPAAEGLIKFKGGKLETDAEWNELVKGDHLNITLNHTSELLGGMKNEYILGLKTEGVIGLHSEINVGGKLETFIGVKVSFEIGGEVKFGGLFEDKTYPLKSSKFAARVENWACKACIGATTIMQGLKII